MWRILLEFTAAVLAALLFVVLVLPFGAANTSQAPTVGRPDVSKSPDESTTPPNISSHLNKQN